MKLNKYLHLFADCIPVKGAKHSVIMDIGRKELYEISNDYIELISKFRNNTIGSVFKEFSEDDIENKITPFISYVLDCELGHLISDPEEFPAIDFSYNDYSNINNAIIDINKKNHNFQQVFKELDELGTKYIQIRFYKSASISDLSKIIVATEATSFYSIEIICSYESELDSTLSDFLKLTPIITSFTLTNCDKNEIENIYLDEKSKTLISRIIRTKQKVNSCLDCGIINRRNMVIPDIQGVSEIKKFNSCLNKKISIDVDGKIRNCPSMKEDFGLYTTGKLKEIVRKEDFKAIWNVNKDTISVCKDCEYRYVCSDCRAFIADTKKDKPLKCKYNPYTGIWEK